MRRAGPPPSDVVPNLAPMVDVIMVLLIFFLLGTSLEIARQGVLETQLDPSSGPGAGAAVQIMPRVRIGLADANDGAGASIFLNDEPLAASDFDGLGRLLAQRRAAGADPSNPVVIGAEQNVRWQFVISAMDACVQAGFRNVQFAVSFRQGALGA